MEVEELRISVEEHFWENLIGFLVNFFSIFFKVVTIENDEPNENFFFVVVPNLEVSDGILQCPLPM